MVKALKNAIKKTVFDHSHKFKYYRTIPRLKQDKKILVSKIFETFQYILQNFALIFLSVNCILCNQVAAVGVCQTVMVTAVTVKLL